jgi:hypothetical protein
VIAPASPVLRPASFCGPVHPAVTRLCEADAPREDENMIERTGLLPRILLLLGLIAASFSLASWSGDGDCDIAGIDADGGAPSLDLNNDC